MRSMLLTCALVLCLAIVGSVGQSPDVRIEPFPERPYLNATRGGLELHNDFIVTNDSARPLTVTRVEMSVFGRDGRRQRSRRRGRERGPRQPHRRRRVALPPAAPGCSERTVAGQSRRHRPRERRVQRPGPPARWVGGGPDRRSRDPGRSTWRDRLLRRHRIPRPRPLPLGERRRPARRPRAARAVRTVQPRRGEPNRVHRAGPDCNRRHPRERRGAIASKPSSARHGW